MKTPKEDTVQQVETPKEETGNIHDQLSLGQVHGYTDFLKENGRAEYAGRAIHVVSQHPLDQCVKRSIIEDYHRQIGKSLRTIYDCAFSKSHGRIYNDLGEGNSDLDAATIYKYIWTFMPKRQAELVRIICFTEADIDGKYLKEVDYDALYKLAPNIQRAFDELDEAILAARKMLKSRIKAAKEAEENALQ